MFIYPLYYRYNMTQVNQQGYVIKNKGKADFTSGIKTHNTAHMIIYNRDVDTNPSVELRKVYFPPHMAGRRVRIKVELLPE
jgi:hypothetical protein